MDSNISFHCELTVSILHEVSGRDGGASPRIATLPGEYGEPCFRDMREARCYKDNIALDAVRTLHFAVA